MKAGKRELSVVADQVGAPTYAPFLAAALADLAERRASGVCHYRNREPVSWHGFACEIARQWDPGVRVEAIDTVAMPRPARRPAYSVLDVSKYERLVGRPVEPWIRGLSEYVDRLRARRY
jgi:dTDP-4-dehydrorhamnose reductase